MKLDKMLNLSHVSVWAGLPSAWIIIKLFPHLERLSYLEVCIQMSVVFSFLFSLWPALCRINVHYSKQPKTKGTFSEENQPIFSLLTCFFTSCDNELSAKTLSGEPDETSTTCVWFSALLLTLSHLLGIIKKYPDLSSYATLTLLVVGDSLG